MKNNILNLFFDDDDDFEKKTIDGIDDLTKPIPSGLDFVCKKYDKYAEGGKTEIYDECSKNNSTDKNTCESNIKCEYINSACKYKERNLQDLKKYSISRIYK